MKKYPKRKTGSGVDRYGRNELINYVIENNIKRINKLLKKGSDVNCKDDNGWTPLHFASQEFNEEIIELLLNNGADPNAQDINGNTPLSTALFNCKGAETKIFDLFKNKGGNPEIKNNHGVSTLDTAEQVTNFDLKKHFPEYFKK